jgi:hypothetical protein
MRQGRAHHQPDLFHLNQAAVRLRVAERAELLPLVRDLLREILSSQTPDSSSEGSGDE